MSNNNILSRVKLLMEYDMSKTSSENKKTILEQPGVLSAALKATAKNTVDDAIRGVKGGVKTTAGKAITNSDDLIRAINRGTVSAQNIGKVRVALLKNPGISANVRTQLIDDMVQSTTVSNRYKGLTSTEIEKKFTTAGYPKEVGKEIGKKIVAANKVAGKTVVSGAKGTVKNMPRNVSVTSTVFNRVSGLIAKGWTWAKILAWGLGIGLTGLTLWWIWKTFTGSEPTDEDGNVVPQPSPTPRTSYRDCEGKEIISLGCKSSAVKQLQGCIGVSADGAWGPKTQVRMEQLGLGGGINVSDIPQICKTSDEVEQEARKRANDQQYPRVQGTEDDINFSSDGTDTSIQVSFDNDVEDFS
jgi:hypothetical protein